MSLARVKAQVMGARYVDDGASIRVEAPPFHVWRCSRVHELVCTDAADALARMAPGVERCPDSQDCDWCTENRLLTIVR